MQKIDVIDGIHRQDVHGDDAPANAAVWTGKPLPHHLRPTARRRPQVDDGASGLEEMLLLIELNELIDGACAVALRSGALHERIINVAFDPGAVGSEFFGCYGHCGPLQLFCVLRCARQTSRVGTCFIPDPKAASAVGADQFD